MEYDSDEREWMHALGAASRKRARDTTAAKVAILRSTLATRVAQGIPRYWFHAAAAAKVSSAESFLLHLGRSIAAAIQSVAEFATTARDQLRETRSALHAAIDARCDELGLDIDTAESGKVVSLERELIAVDAALDRWRVESAALRATIALLPDGELEAQHELLSSRVDDLEAQMQALPTAVVEPPFVGVSSDTTQLLPIFAGFGRVHATPRLTTESFCLKVVPSSTRMRDSLHLRVFLGANHSSLSAAESEYLFSMLAVSTNVEALLEGPAVEPRVLQATWTPDTAQRCMNIYFCIPPSFFGGAFIRVSTVHMAGQSLLGLPLVFPVCRGIAAPLVLLHDANIMTNPCICPQGRVFCPPGKGPEVQVFDADGMQLPGYDVESLGLHGRKVRWAATCIRSGSPSLLLADDSRLVAIDTDTRAVHWRVYPGTGESLRGLAILPSLGVVVVCNRNFIFAHRMSDGKCVGKLRVPRLAWCLAADASTDTVYGSIKWQKRVGIHSWSCVSDGSDVLIACDSRVVGAESKKERRPLAVMPPAPGKNVSHLIVGTISSKTLRVLALPDLTLVHTHKLKGLKVLGLAADPRGRALAVCDEKTSIVVVLPWPLPGMRSLK